MAFHAYCKSQEYPRRAIHCTKVVNKRDTAVFLLFTLQMMRFLLLHFDVGTAEPAFEPVQKSCPKEPIRGNERILIEN